MKLYDAVLFDLDGLLIDSEPLGLQALDLLLARYDRSAPPTFGYQLIGRRAQDNADLVIATFDLPHTSAELIAEQREIIEQLVKRHVEPLPGAVELLHAVRGWGLRTAMATSSLRSYAQIVLDKFDWHDLFDATVTGDEVAHGKPAPDLFERAAALLAVAPDRCLVLEDAPAGVAAGLAAGADVIAVPNTITQRLAFPPDVPTMPSLHSVLAWLRSRFESADVREESCSAC